MSPNVRNPYNFKYSKDPAVAANTKVENAASINYELPLGFALPAGYRIYCTFGTSTTGGIIATVIGGDY
jgi:hypothetical protein